MSMNENGVVSKVAAEISVDISPWEKQLQKAADSFDQFNAKLKASGASLQNVLDQGAKSTGDKYLQQADGTIRTLRQSIQALQMQYKQGILDAETLLTKLQSLKTAYATALDPNQVGYNTSFANDMALQKAIQNAETELSKFQDFELTSERAMAQQQAAIDAENTARYNTSVDQKVTQVKMLHDLQLQSAQESASQLATIYEEDYGRFESDINKKMQLLKTMYQYEQEAAKQAAASTAASGTTSVGLTQALGVSSHSR